MRRLERRAFGPIVLGALVCSVLALYSSTGYCDAGPLTCATSGSIISHPHIYLTYWRSTKNGSPDPAGDPQGLFSPLATWLGAVGGSDSFDAITQYSNGSSVIYNDTGMFINSWTDTTAVPANITEADLKSAAIRAAQHFNVESDPDAIQLLATDALRQGVGCGAHHASATDGANTIPYIDLPYVTNGCGSSKTDMYFFFASHELAETITDPRYDTTGAACLSPTGAEIV